MLNSKDWVTLRPMQRFTTRPPLRAKFNNREPQINSDNNQFSETPLRLHTNETWNCVVSKAPKKATKNGSITFIPCTLYTLPRYKFISSITHAAAHSIHNRNPAVTWQTIQLRTSNWIEHRCKKRDYVSLSMLSKLSSTTPAILWPHFGPIICIIRSRPRRLFTQSTVLCSFPRSSRSPAKMITGLESLIFSRRNASKTTRSLTT